MAIKHIGIIGAGQMGNGIAHVAAQNGFQVTIQDIAAEALEKATQTIEKNMARELKKEKITEAEKKTAQGLISTTTDLAGLAACDLVIEAATENEVIKAAIYKDLAKHLKPEAIMASNTSSISITKLGSLWPNPEQFIGMHFFNPVPMMDLVEIIRGMATSDQTFNVIKKLTEALKKNPVAAGDAPGFIVNRIAVPMLNEAIFALHEGLGDVVSIDQAVQLGLKHPMGPLALADYIGLDTVLSVMQVLQKETGDPKYRPCPLLIKMVEAGWLGIKAKKGFYDYTQDPPKPLR